MSVIVEQVLKGQAQFFLIRYTRGWTGAQHLHAIRHMACQVKQSGKYCSIISDLANNGNYVPFDINPSKLGRLTLEALPESQIGRWYIASKDPTVKITVNIFLLNRTTIRFIQVDTVEDALSQIGDAYNIT